jgi:hypothetical protein
LHTVEQEREIRAQAVTIAQKALDDMIMDAYGITNPTHVEREYYGRCTLGT